MMNIANSAQPGKIQFPKLVNRLTLRNWRNASIIRFMPDVGYFRVTVVGNRYFDRGAGGFMGPGEWIFEGRVICSAYPEIIEDLPRVPEIKSKAGWGYRGVVSDPSDQMVLVEDKTSSKQEIQALNQEFLTLEEAITYANGDDGNLLAKSSEPVVSSRTKSGYKLKRL